MIQFYSDRPVSRKEAANQLGISLRKLDRKIKEGYIAVRIASDGTRFIFQSDLNRYASGLPMEAKMLDKYDYYEESSGNGFLKLAVIIVITWTVIIGGSILLSNLIL